MEVHWTCGGWRVERGGRVFATGPTAMTRNEVVTVALETTMRPEWIQSFLTVLSELLDWLPTYRGRKVHGARAAADLGRRSEAVEATINERVKLVRRWRRAMSAGLTAQEAADAVGVSRATLYRWRRNPEPRSKRPLKVRRRQWTRAQESAVAAFRCQYPAWGRRRIGHLLRHPVRSDSCAVPISDATVGRILAHLVATGRARPVLCFTAAARKRRQRQARPVKRLRGALKANRPGDAVQIDTLSIRFPATTPSSSSPP